MFDWRHIMETSWVAIFISFLLGFGLAAIFRPLCKGDECVLYRGPPVTEIRDAVYQFGSKCIEFKPKPIECPAAPTTPIADTRITEALR